MKIQCLLIVSFFIANILFSQQQVSILEASQAAIQQSKYNTQDYTKSLQYRNNINILKERNIL